MGGVQEGKGQPRQKTAAAYPLQQRPPPLQIRINSVPSHIQPQQEQAQHLEDAVALQQLLDADERPGQGELQNVGIMFPVHQPSAEIRVRNPAEAVEIPYCAPHRGGEVKPVA